jgi:HAMP domain-containing protein
MIRHSKLATKFTLLLSLVFIGAILMSGFALSKALEQRAEDEINYRGQILIQMINSVREYSATHITTLLASNLENQENFIPETIPSFAAREVFENLRKNKEYTDYFYKDATINPTNTRDQADEFEIKLIDRFGKEPELKTLSGFRNLYGDKLFYSARPFVLKDSACLRCHGIPETAPKNHLETYGTENGFGWKLNEIIATQIVYFPVKEVFDRVSQAFFLFIAIFTSIFTLVILTFNHLLKRNVIQPLKPMAQLAQKISTDTFVYNRTEMFELRSLVAIAKRTDELGQLGQVFLRMVHEVYTREQRLKKQMQELSIQIDETKRTRQVAEIVDAEYFQNLSVQAKEIRKKWAESDSSTTIHEQQ